MRVVGSGANCVADSASCKYSKSANCIVLVPKGAPPFILVLNAAQVLLGVVTRPQAERRCPDALTSSPRWAPC